MMKSKKMLRLFQLMLVLLLTFCFIGCDFIPSNHVHNYSTQWSMDGENHWHECTCESKIDLASHIPSSWIIDIPATEDAEGLKHRVCTICDITLTVVSIPVLSSSEDEIINLDIYAINDFHGAVMESENSCGIAKTSTYLKNKIATDDNAILISSGDMWQGSAESNNTKGKLVTEWMNELSFSAMVLGNHEYDWSDSVIKANKELANFPFLAINVFDKTTNSRVSYCDASVVVEKSGIKIGIIGAIGDCYSSISSSMVENVSFKTGNELTNLIKNESTRLKNEEDVDIIIYSIHDGWNNSGNFEDNDFYDMSLSSGDYVDIVLEAHIHSSYTFKDSYGVYHIQAGGYNQQISHIDMDYNKQEGKLVVNDDEIIYTTSLKNLSSDQNTLDIIEKYRSEIGNVDEIIGYNNANRDQVYLKQLTADLYLESALKKWPDYDIVLGGGYISCRDPYYLASGDVSYGNIQNLFPFDNNVVLCTILGSDLLSNFIETPNINYFIRLSEYGRDIRYSIDNNKTYYIVTDSYSLDYKYNNLTYVDALDSNGIYARDLIAEYAKNGGFGINPSDIAGIEHSGTLTDPYSVSDAYILCENTGSNKSGPFYFQGTVTEVNETLGANSNGLSFYISDGTNEIFCYYIDKFEGAHFNDNWTNSSELKVNDEVILYSKYFDYTNPLNIVNHELVNGYVVSINNIKTVRG